MDLERNGTWTITELPPGKKKVSCKWLFTAKHKADRSIEKLKPLLVARGFTQSYDIDYQKTFPHVAKLNTIRIFLSLEANLDRHFISLIQRMPFLMEISKRESTWKFL